MTQKTSEKQGISAMTPYEGSQPSQGMGGVNHFKDEDEHDEEDGDPARLHESEVGIEFLLNGLRSQDLTGEADLERRVCRGTLQKAKVEVAKL